jgi:hypothetical protein
MVDTERQTERYVLLLAIIVDIFGSLYKLLGYTVVQLFEALRYKPEGHGFDSQWCQWYFSLA